LFEVPFSDDSDEEIRRIRSLLALARAVFVMWLGAVDDISKPAIDEFTPWRQQDIMYHGLASHNPLVYDINDPKEMKERAEEEGLRRAMIIRRRLGEKT